MLGHSIDVETPATPISIFRGRSLIESCFDPMSLSFAAILELLFVTLLLFFDFTFMAFVPSVKPLSLKLIEVIIALILINICWIAKNRDETSLGQSSQAFSNNPWCKS